MNVRLFDYQEDMMNRILSELRTHRAVMAQMPTGTGKTYLLAAIVKAYVNEGGRRQILIVAHRRELVEQILETCGRFGLSDVVTVKSIQWLNLHREKMISDEERGNEKHIKHENAPSLVVIDEAHHALAKTYRRLWKELPKAKFLGLTATPYRLNGRGFDDLFDVLVTSYSVREFIRMRRLSLFDYVSIKGDSEEQRLVDSLTKRGADGDYQVKEMGMVLNNRPTIEKLFQAFKKYAEHKKGIVYAIDITHARAIADFYREQGVAAVVIDSKTPNDLRKELLLRFKNSSFGTSDTSNQTSYQTSNQTSRQSLLHQIQVLVNVDIFSEGFDCPDVEVVQLARPTLSLAKYLQMVGRGLRVTEGKECCTIIDNVGLYRLFGLPSEDWNWQRIFRGWKKRELDSLRGGSGKEGTQENLVALYASQHEQTIETARNEELDREVGMVVSHDMLWQAMAELPAEYDRYEVKQNLKSRRLTVWDTWNERKKKVDIFCNDSIYDKRGLLLNCHTGYKQWDALDLKNMQRYPVGRFPSAKVCYVGDFSLLRINGRYITRTRKPYVCEFPIREQDVEWHDFYLLLHDPQSQHPLPVCVLAGDEKRTYWWVAPLKDGKGICVMDDEEHFYFAYPDKSMKGVSQKKGRALMPSSQSLQDAVENIEREHQVEVRKVGCKFALYVDGKMVVPPLYRKMELAEHGYCKVQVKPQLWGLITLMGKVVVEPDYADVKVIDKQHAITINLVGKEKVITFNI